jgi:hypothetical protein
MRNIEIMLSDGMLGNKSILLALSCFATGNLNSKLKKDANHFKMPDILPLAYDYISPPLTDEEKKEQLNRNLLTFLQQSPNAPVKTSNA